MKIKNMSHAEDAIRRIAELEAAISAVDAAAAAAVAAAKAKADEDSRELVEERSDLLEALQGYSDSHRDELFQDGKKSVELTNGTIGYRQSPDKVEVSKDTAELLIAAGLGHCVKVSREPVKAALKGMDAEMLEKFHVRIVPGRETFYVNASAQVVAGKTA